MFGRAQGRTSLSALKSVGILFWHGQITLEFSQFVLCGMAVAMLKWQGAHGNKTDDTR